MANQTNAVADTGYGNIFVDSLVWGCGWTDGAVNSSINATASDPVNITYSALTVSTLNGLYDVPPPIGTFTYWYQDEIDLIAEVMNNFESVCNVSFTYVEDTISDINFLAVNDMDYLTGNPYVLGFADVPDYTYPNVTVNINIQDSWEYFGIEKGSYNYVTLQHELGHAMGLAHPHDGGYVNPEVFPGLTLLGIDEYGPYYDSSDVGEYGQNQGIFTTMSYNTGFAFNPSPSMDYGYEGTLMAFDIAALQAIYGANTNYNTGDNIYYLPSANIAETAYYSCIWDAGGTDTISNEGSSLGCGINLNYATLDVNDGFVAGGYLSGVNDIYGGFTIANGALIENASGGSGDDVIYGNALDNILNGGDGNDYLYGQGGNDNINGGNGTDTLSFSDGINLEDIFIRKSKDGGYTVITDDGTDSITGIEYFEAADGISLVSTFYSTMEAPTLNYILNGVSTSVTLTPYTGIVSWIDYTFIGSDDTQIFTGTEYSEFMNLLGGVDAANGGGGDDVIDGGRGSNFLTGGSGKDTFFIDGRGGQITWSTITDLTSEDAVNLWGWQDGVSQLILVLENQGAEAFKGLTYYYDLDGNGLIETSLTFSGLTLADFNEPTINTSAAVPYVDFSLVAV